MGSRKPTNARRPQRGRSHALLYSAAALFLIVAGLVLFARRANASVHPKPRADAEQMATMDPNDFSDADTKEAYTMAAKIKKVLDGLFCYCYCKGGGHYSLLDCFKDEHGAGCDICKGEARLAYKLAQEGASLQQIRAAIDAQFGTQ